jgi:DNA-binding transcriptional ArsR family regulator
MKNQFEIKNINKAIITLKAIDHKFRKDILKLIESKKEITVTEIYKKLQMEQSVVSQHLALLRACEIVKTKKVGRFIKYSINNEKIQHIKSKVEELLK